jgi:hypothetical protein
LQRRICLLERELKSQSLQSQIVQPAAGNGSAKRLVAQKLRKIDSVVEAKLAGPSRRHVEFDAMPTPRSVKQFITVLKEQLHATVAQKNGQSISQRGYHSLKSHSKRIARKVIK